MSRNWVVDFEKNRLDNVLCYFKDGAGGYILTGLCVYTDVYSYVEAVSAKGSLEPLGDLNSRFIHPTSGRRHVALYTDGTAVMDGYGTLLNGVSFNSGYLSDGLTTVQVYHTRLHDYEKWKSNVAEKKLDNVYGVIPSASKVKISDMTDQLGASSLTGFEDYEDIVALYTHPNKVRKRIQTNCELYRYMRP